ncbi:hypothetical protein ABN224_21735 [Providencia rettgeri]|uniref:hypothetical protein n=1 Tax=Proteus terrae TaxID=1574161 RepID=UPI0032DA5CF8
MSKMNLYELAKHGLRGETELYDVYGKSRRARRSNNALSRSVDKNESETVLRACQKHKVK